MNFVDFSIYKMANNPITHFHDIGESHIIPKFYVGLYNVIISVFEMISRFFPDAEKINILFTNFINFLLRAIDRFLGKGLDVGTILEYLFLNLAWIIALSVPMAVLLASLMTFGRMSEDNEINAMRSSGISFLSIIRSPLMFGVLVALVLTFFNNFIQSNLGPK